MANIKTIKNLRIPFWALPLRAMFRLFKRLLPDNSVLKQVTVDGIRYLVWANEDIGKKLILLRSFEKNETEAFRRMVKNGDICVDVGGNVGYYSLNLARFSGPTGKVYVFEPIRRNALVISLALELNDFENVEVLQSAVSNTAGTVSLSIPSVDGAYAYINNGSEKLNGDREQVARCVTLDDFLSDHGEGRVDVMKIDVEGAEGLVLAGGCKLLEDGSRKPRVIMIEMVSDFLGRFGSNIPDIVDYLQACGYQPFYAKNGRELTPYRREDYDQVFNVFFILDKSQDGFV